MTEDELTLPKGVSIADARDALSKYSEKDNPAVVETERVEALSEVRGVMQDALADQTNLKEETVEALSFEALCAEFRTDDGELEAEALVQTPESGQPEDDGTEALAEDADVEKAEALYADYERFENDRLKEDIVESLGVEDFEVAKEVLN